MKQRKTDTSIQRWRKPGSEGFFAFIEDLKPMIPGSGEGYIPYTIPNEKVREEIRRALDGDYQTLVFCWPRRHGKTIVVELINIWRFLTRRTQAIAIISNSATQSVDTSFKLVRTILQQTPYTRALIDKGAIEVYGDYVSYPALDNRIQGYAANAAALYGKRLSIAQVSELHAARNDDVFQILASSTIDSDDGIVLVDSTVGPRSSPLYGLYQLAQNGQDESVYFSHIFYRDLQDAMDNAPSWIKPSRLKSRAAQMLPIEFAQQHLNQWQAGSSSLFPVETIEKCKDIYPLDVSAIAQHRAYAVGSGLDRAYGFSLHGDATIASCVLKVSEDDEEAYYVLASDNVMFSNAAGIKKHFTRYKTQFGMTKAAIESYNSQDIGAWCAEQAFEHEIVHATAERQSNVFTALFNAASEGRLHIHPKFERLLSEMETFEYKLDSGKKGTIAKFEHAQGCHDDTVYSLAWAIYALREVELNPYEIESIYCDAAPRTATLCFINGKGKLTPFCSENCASYKKIESLHDNYKSRNPLNSLSLNDFYSYKVVNIGTHTIRR